MDIGGKILPGLKVIASYAYTNAVVTEDNTVPVGDRFANVPEHQAALWTTYEIQNGGLKGLGFGLGLFYMGKRPAELPNSSFEIPGYFRTDAALYYRIGGLNAAINISNLFDTDYSYGTTYVVRSEPLRITGSISWEF
ncbi:TonB-dependent receptor [Nostoc sp. LPT]|uniref:TonB-dependent receptor domain-containing protein n=1 Tax=Nostoc sp. LPT TaxID=2815387 RepID=UPI0026001210|nr:TonB-dependent receptor [Nostoc sp. LPT]